MYYYFVSFIYKAERDHAELIKNHYATRITELTSQVCCDPYCSYCMTVWYDTITRVVCIVVQVVCVSFQSSFLLCYYATATIHNVTVQCTVDSI